MNFLVELLTVREQGEATHEHYYQYRSYGRFCAVQRTILLHAKNAQNITNVIFLQLFIFIIIFIFIFVLVLSVI